MCWLQGFTIEISTGVSQADRMDIEDLLKSRAGGFHFCAMMEMTEAHAAYPGTLPAPRAGILKRLQKLDAQTRDTLDTYISGLRDLPLQEPPGPEALFVLRQRLHCALFFLDLLLNSSPAPRWIYTQSEELRLEDRWLLIGVWREFGELWLRRLAQELSTRPSAGRE